MSTCLTLFFPPPSNNLYFRKTIHTEAKMYYHVIIGNNDLIDIIPKGITKICFKLTKSITL